MTGTAAGGGRGGGWWGWGAWLGDGRRGALAEARGRRDDGACSSQAAAHRRRNCTGVRAAPSRSCWAAPPAHHRYIGANCSCQDTQRRYIPQTRKDGRELLGDSFHWSRSPLERANFLLGLS